MNNVVIYDVEHRNNHIFLHTLEVEQENLKFISSAELEAILQRTSSYKIMVYTLQLWIFNCNQSLG